MSELIKHECGIALIRLRKPLAYYLEKYGTPMYAVNKLYLLMEKQRNRGQDGAGVANIKIDTEPGYRYISRYRSTDIQPIDIIFNKIKKIFQQAREEGKEKYFDAKWLKKQYGFTGEVWLGHLRYGTHGKNKLENCHPILRQNNWRSRNLVLAGNFNMTNVDELFQILLDLGQSPKEKIDTVTIMEKIGHFLDLENENLYKKYKDTYSKREISHLIEDELDLQRVLEKSCKDFDGGYTMAGMIGHGTAFVTRDPNGIRPAYYYANDEIVVVASEKPAIKTAFDIEYDEIKEVNPGYALIINKNGDYQQKRILKPREKKSCSFERIYFSRGSDPDIYNERKELGKLLVPQILEEVDYDLDRTVFSYIPNTAESAFLGMLSALDDYLIRYRKRVIMEGQTTKRTLDQLLGFKPRVEKIVIKDAQLRTFITEGDARDDLVSHVYDTTYEVIKKGEDTLVVIDDSIVRGTTLEKSIVTMLDRLEPKKMIIVSSAPQIRYPDCYGIDMSRMGEFVAFRAVLKLLKETGMDNLLDEVYEKCTKSSKQKKPPNYVKELYDPFTHQQISQKVAQIVTPKDLKADLHIIYQTVENLHKACPNHLGDWYFTGDYPTPGGNRVVNKAFLYFMEGKVVRAY